MKTEKTCMNCGTSGCDYKDTRVCASSGSHSLWTAEEEDDDIHPAVVLLDALQDRPIIEPGAAFIGKCVKLPPNAEVNGEQSALMTLRRRT